MQFSHDNLRFSIVYPLSSKSVSILLFSFFNGLLKTIIYYIDKSFFYIHPLLGGLSLPTYVAASIQLTIFYHTRQTLYHLRHRSSWKSNVYWCVAGISAINGNSYSLILSLLKSWKSLVGANEHTVIQTPWKRTFVYEGCYNPTLWSTIVTRCIIYENIYRYKKM